MKVNCYLVFTKTRTHKEKSPSQWTDSCYSVTHIGWKLTLVSILFHWFSQDLICKFCSRKYNFILKVFLRGPWIVEMNWNEPSTKRIEHRYKLCDVGESPGELNNVFWLYTTKYRQSIEVIVDTMAWKHDYLGYIHWWSVSFLIFTFWC